MSERRITVSPLAVLILVVAVIGGILFLISLFNQPPTTKEILAKQKVAIIGDSLTEQNGNGVSNLEAMFEKAGFNAQNLYIYGVDGKKIAAPDKYETTTLQNIEQARKKLRHPNVWLIALGTNDRARDSENVTADIKAVMKEIGKDKVLWVNTSSRDQSYKDSARVNTVMKDTLKDYPNAKYLDWDSYIHMAGSKSDWKPLTDNTDPIHMTDEGYIIRNAFYMYRIAAAVDKTITQ